MLILQIAGGILLAVFLMNLWAQAQESGSFDYEWDRRQAQLKSEYLAHKAATLEYNRRLRKTWTWRQWVLYFFQRHY